MTVLRRYGLHSPLGPGTHCSLCFELLCKRTLQQVLKDSKLHGMLNVPLLNYWEAPFLLPLPGLLGNWGYENLPVSVAQCKNSWNSRFAISLDRKANDEQATTDLPVAFAFLRGLKPLKQKNKKARHLAWKSWLKMHWERGGSWRGHVAEVGGPCVQGFAVNFTGICLEVKRNNNKKSATPFLGSQSVRMKSWSNRKENV